MNSWAGDEPVMVRNVKCSRFGFALVCVASSAIVVGCGSDSNATVKSPIDTTSAANATSAEENTAPVVETLQPAMSPPYDTTDLCSMFDSAQLAAVSGGGPAQSSVGANSTEAAEIQASGSGGPIIGICSTGGADVILSDRFTDEGADSVYLEFTRSGIIEETQLGTAKLAELVDLYVGVKRNVNASCTGTGLDAAVRLANWQGGIREACLDAMTTLLTNLP